MQRLNFALMVAILVANPCFAQSSDVRCKPENCTVEFHQGLPFKVLKADRAIVSIAVIDTGRYDRVTVVFTNLAAEPVNLIPSSFLALVLEPKEKLLAYQDPAKIARSIQRRMALANGLTAMGSSMQTQRTVTNTTSNGNVSVTGSGGYANATYSGTSTSTTTQPDYEARAAAQRQIAENNQWTADATQNLFKTALLANTVAPGQTIAGEVYFERDKKATRGIVTIPVGNDNYIFEVKK